MAKNTDTDGLQIKRVFGVGITTLEAMLDADEELKRVRKLFPDTKVVEDPVLRRVEKGAAFEYSYVIVSNEEIKLANHKKATRAKRRNSKASRAALSKKV